MFKKYEKGVTLVELLLVASILAIVMGAIALPFRSGRESWQTGDRHAEVMQNALIGMDKMTREIRQGQYVTAVSDYTDPNGSISFVDKDGNESKFQFDGSSGEFLKYGGASAGYDDLPSLAGPITNLKFTCYPAGVTGGTTWILNQESPPASIGETGVVKINMVTKDNKGVVANIPLTSLVMLSPGSVGPGGGGPGGGGPGGGGENWGDGVNDYAIFGAAGINIKNGAIISSMEESGVANIGTSIGDIDIKQNLNINGNIISGGSLNFNEGALTAKNAKINKNADLNNNSVIENNLFANGFITWDPNTVVGGIVSYADGGGIEPNKYDGKLNVSDSTVPLAADVFSNPLPKRATYAPIDDFVYHDFLPEPYELGYDETEWNYWVIFPFHSGNVSLNNPGESATLTPGIYGNLTMKGGNTLNLESGDYFFTGINIKESVNNNILNINLSDGDGIRIFVGGNFVAGDESGEPGDFSFGSNLIINITLPPSEENTFTPEEKSKARAQRVYIETLGDCFVDIKKSNPPKKWHGTIFAHGNVIVNNANIYGALYSRNGMVTLNNPDCSVTYVSAVNILPYVWFEPYGPYPAQ